MLIGHIPAGYLLTRRLLRGHPPGGRAPTGPWLWLGLVSSILPDFDLTWFYLVDQGRITHHHYWTHRPQIWIVLLCLWLAATTLAHRPRLRLGGLLVAANAIVHIGLDGLWAKIDWLYPWSSRGYALIHVPPVHSFWILNFVLHWTFLVELAVVTWAGVTFLRDRRRARAAPIPIGD